MKKYINHVLLAAILFVSLYAEMKSEISNPLEIEEKGAFTDFYFGIGLAGTNFLEDTPSWVPISFSPDENDYRIGGSFDGVESGLHLSFVTNLDSESNWMLPLNFEYNWLSANEEIYYSKTIGKYHHRIDVQKISTGIHWNFYTFHFQDVNAYMGAEFKAVFVNNQKLTSQQITKQDDGTITTVNGPYKNEKPNAVRLGSEYKLGFRGELVKNFYINSFLGIELLNLLGRDDERRELFTPYKKGETQEQYVAQWHFVLLIEYKL